MIATLGSGGPFSLSTCSHYACYHLGLWWSPLPFTSGGLEQFDTIEDWLFASSLPQYDERD
jgi:hypothetical protein